MPSTIRGKEHCLKDCYRKEHSDAVSACLADEHGLLVLPAQRNKKNEGGDSDARPTGVPAPPPKTDPQSAEIALQVRLPWWC